MFDAEAAKQFTLKEMFSSVGINSFADPRSDYQEDCPPPVPFSDDILLEKLPILKAEAVKGFELRADGALVCRDEKMLQKQRGVLAEVAKQLVTNFFKGLSIAHISLPIKIFEPRSSI